MCNLSEVSQNFGAAPRRRGLFGHIEFIRFHFSAWLQVIYLAIEPTSDSRVVRGKNNTSEARERHGYSHLSS